MTFKLLAVIISGIIAVAIFDFNLIRKIIKYIKNHYHFRKIDYNYMEIYNLINKMSSRGFEIFCCELFKELGYKAYVTSQTNDYGRDIICKNKKETIYVECKHYTRGEPIGREICEKLIGSCVAFNVNHAIIITVSSFNNNAFEYQKRIYEASGFNLEFWDMEDIMKNVNKISVENIPNIMTKAFMLQDDDVIKKMEGILSNIQNKNKTLNDF